MSRKRGGCGTFFFGFLTGFLALIIAVAGVGTWAYFGLNIHKVEKVIKVEVPVGNDDFKELPLKDLIALVSKLVSGSGDLTLTSLERDYGLTLPDSLGGMDLTKIKDAVKDCGITDFAGMFKSVSSKLTISDIITTMGSEVSDSMKALGAYTLDDLTGTNGGLGIEGIMKEVTIGELLGVDKDAVDKPTDVDDVVWLLRSYTVLGDNGIQNMSKDLSMSDLSALGIKFGDSEILRSIASKQKADEAGNLQFVDNDKTVFTFKEGALFAEDGTAADLAGFAVKPKIADGELVYNAQNKLLYVDGAAEYTYDAVDKKFLKAEDGTAATPAEGNRLSPRLYMLDELGASVNSLTLGELLGDELPSALQSFKNTRLDNLGDIGVDNIYISDILPEGTTSGVLFNLSKVQGTKDVFIGAAETATTMDSFKLGDTYLYRETVSEGNYNYYTVEKSVENNVTKWIGTLHTLTAEEVESLVALSYSVADIDKAVDELTLDEVLGQNTDGSSKIPDMLSGFADTKIKDLSKELKVENIYLTDIAGEKPAGVLKSLVEVQGKVKIDLLGDGVLVEASLWRTRPVEGQKVKKIVYYAVGSGDELKLYVKNAAGGFESAPAGIAVGDLDTLSYSVADVNEAMDQLTLTDVLGGADKVPSILGGFANVQVKDLADQLKPGNIYLTDIADGMTGMLRDLADKQGRVTISLDDGLTSSEALLYRSKDKSTVYYYTGNVFYKKVGEKFVACPELSEDDVTAGNIHVLSYSVNDIEKSVKSSTVKELIGELSGTFKCLNDVTIGNLPDKLKTLTIGEMFGTEANSGALSLIPSGTTIDQIPTELTKVMKEITLQKLFDAELLPGVTQEQLDKVFPEAIITGNRTLGSLKLTELVNVVTKLI